MSDNSSDMARANNQVVTHLLEREAARGRALLARDVELLASLLAEDLRHVHSTGVLHDKAAYLEYVRGPLILLSMERRDVRVTLHGTAAIMTGYMSSVMQPPGPVAPVKVESHVTQMWIQGAAGWQLALFQATRVPAARP